MDFNVLSDFVPDAPAFRTQEALAAPLRDACAASRGVARFYDFGISEEGRPLYGVVMGHGPQTVSLMAGAHADEPVGPETLRTFILESLRRADRLDALWQAVRLVIIPHINPDGEVRNQPWIRQWPSLDAFLVGVVREAPGRDLEFGFPGMRVENQHVAAFLRVHAPFDLHMSLHGMAFSEGAMVLIERHWAGARTEVLRRHFAAAVQEAGLRLHDHNRKGEKGFFYIEPGFTTTPEGAAMRAHFQALGDAGMASRFQDSSMEFVRSFGSDPFCLVTELPLFVVNQPRSTAAGVPAAYLAFKERLPDLTLEVQRGRSSDEVRARFGIEPLPLRTALRLHLRTLALALAQMLDAPPFGR